MSLMSPPEMNARPGAGHDDGRDVLVGGDLRDLCDEHVDLFDARERVARLRAVECQRCDASAPFE